jgi:hypothetical protein
LPWPGLVWHPGGIADQNDILVSNLRDALQQAQRYIFAGILSAGLFVVIDQEGPELLRSGERVDIPYLGKVTSGLAGIALFSAYFIFGLLANSAIGRIKKIVLKIHDDEVATAALTQFSIVTVESRTIRIITVLLAPALMGVCLLIERSRGATQSLAGLTLGVVLLCSPYLFLLCRVINPIKKDTTGVE